MGYSVFILSKAVSDMFKVKEGEVIDVGIYRFCRHPLILSEMIFHVSAYVINFDTKLNYPIAPFAYGLLVLFVVIPRKEKKLSSLN